MDGPSPLSIGGYRLVRQLHESAAGTVWEAIRGGRRFALKRVLRGPARQRSREWLGAEYHRGLALDHPHIALPLTWVEEGSEAAIVFDFLAGGDLAGLAGFPPAVWARMLLDVLSALQYMHRQGFVHRDVKARNVMLDSADRVRLIDLGSTLPAGAPATVGGTTAPNHPRESSHIATANDDLYAFARLAFEMLAGRPLTAAESRQPASDLAGAVEALLNSSAADITEKLHSLVLVLELQASRTESL